MSNDTLVDMLENNRGVDRVVGYFALVTGRHGVRPRLIRAGFSKSG